MGQPRNHIYGVGATSSGTITKFGKILYSGAITQSDISTRDMSQGTEPSSSQLLVLHIWPGKWNLLSIDPSSLTTVLYLQLAIPGQFYISECTNPDLSPTGQCSI